MFGSITDAFIRATLTSATFILNSQHLVLTLLKQNNLTMPRKLLSGTWERWSTVFNHFNDQAELPILDREYPFHDEVAFENCLNYTWEDVISEDVEYHSVTIHLVEISSVVETSSCECDIIAFSVTRKTRNGRLLGGEVVTELPSNQPKFFNYDESIPGMGIVKFDEKGKVIRTFIKAGWLVAYVSGSNAKANANKSEETIIQIAKERALWMQQDASSLEAEFQFEGVTHQARHREHDEALNSSKKEIHELKEMLKAREDKIKTMKQSHLQVKAQLESENQRLQTSNARLQQDFDALRRRAQDTEGGLQRLTDRLSDDKTEMQLATDCIRQVEKIRFATYEQLEKERNEFKKFCHMTGGEVADKDSRIRDLQQQLTRLQEQPPKSKQRLVIKLPMPSSSHLSKEEGRHGGALDSIDASNGKGNSLTSGRDEVSSLKNELEETKNDLLNKSDKIVQLEKQLAQYLSIIKNNAYTAMQSSDKHHQLVHLEKELETTRQELKSRTDELASATEKHAQELKETGGTEGKCACKDKEAYLNSVEGHVESLRGAMEEVLSKDKEHRENMRETMEIALRRVSTFQGRKRRRTEGGDFDY